MSELIDREALMKYPIRINNYDKKHGNEHFILGVESVLEFAEQLPTIDAVEVVHGEWLLDTQFATKSKYRCSLCERLIMGSVENPNIKFPYCHCGAKMDGKRRESEVV